MQWLHCGHRDKNCVGFLVSRRHVMVCCPYCGVHVVHICGIGFESPTIVACQLGCQSEDGLYYLYAIHSPLCAFAQRSRVQSPCISVHALNSLYLHVYEAMHFLIIDGIVRTDWLSPPQNMAVYLRHELNGSTEIKSLLPLLPPGQPCTRCSFGRNAAISNQHIRAVWFRATFTAKAEI